MLVRSDAWWQIVPKKGSSVRERRLRQDGRIRKDEMGGGSFSTLRLEVLILPPLTEQLFLDRTFS